MRLFLVCAALVSACASSPEQSPGTAAPIIAAERAFAADAAQRGWAAAFRSAAAPDAITLSPDPVNAQENLAKIDGDGSTALDWRPAFAGVARSGEFGFTTGPFLFRAGDGIAGHYFTVWRRQADGAWKWIFDAGTSVADPGPAVAADAEIPVLAVSAGGAGSASAAIAEVEAIEAQIMNMEETLPNDVVIAFLAPDAHVNRPGAAPAIGVAAATDLISRDGPTAYRPLQHEASVAGDMVFSLGEVRVERAGAWEQRHYARIWQKQPQGWRIVFDEMVPRGN